MLNITVKLIIFKKRFIYDQAYFCIDTYLKIPSPYFPLNIDIDLKINYASNMLMDLNLM